MQILKKKNSKIYVRKRKMRLFVSLNGRKYFSIWLQKCNKM